MQSFKDLTETEQLIALQLLIKHERERQALMFEQLARDGMTHHGRQMLTTNDMSAERARAEAATLRSLNAETTAPLCISQPQMLESYWSDSEKRSPQAPLGLFRPGKN